MEPGSDDIQTFFDEMSRFMAMAGFGVDLGTVSGQHEAALRRLSHFDPIQLAASFGGLLMQPNLQANCVRLEALVHLSLALGNGRELPSLRVVADIFEELGKGFAGRMEDPAEDVFVSLIVTPRGNFRILEGVWESAGYYTQRMFNALELLPDHEAFAVLKNRVYAMLALSEAVCARAEVIRNMVGNADPVEQVPVSVLQRLPALRKIIKFSADDLAAIELKPDDLAEFGFDPNKRRELETDHMGHSVLERYPIAFSGEDTYLILPTAVSAAVRRYVIETMELFELRESFSAALADEFARAVSDLPLLGARSGADVEFRQTESGLIAGVMSRADQGRFINLVFFADTLENFDDGGLLGVFPSPDKREGLAQDVDRWIDHAYQNASATEGFRAGLTLVVPCGIGRGVADVFRENKRENWRVEFLSAPDLFTLSWLPDFKSLSLWRLLDGKDRLAELGVDLQNVNGLLNLVAWVRMLGGHLVPHASLPVDFGTGQARNFVMIEQNGLLKTRKEVADVWDVHACQGIDGRWISVRRERDSLFEEDNAKPFFLSQDDVGTRWPLGVYEAPNHAWWIQLETEEAVRGSLAVERFKMLRTWLCLAAPVLDSALPSVPPGSVLLKASFLGEMRDRRTEAPQSFMTLDETLELISFRVDGSTLELEIADGFEQAIFNPVNTAERALVHRLVEGVAALANVALDDEWRVSLLRQIIPSPEARQSHAFMARHFRDFVQGTLGRSPLTIDTDDAALIKLGLGWRARNRSEGPEILGRQECTNFLNKVVWLMEDDLCSALREFDRSSVLEFALLNHERAALDRDRWRRTASAVLALHRDRDAALDVILHHEAALNAVFQASRLLIEFAICQCPLNGGIKPGRLDMSRHMATIMMICGLGGWSDAIHWDAMEPRVRVTPLGDVHANVTFHETVLQPFGRAATQSTVDKSVRDYALNLRDPDTHSTEDGKLDADFATAVQEQFGASVDTLRKFVDFIENVGITKRQGLLVMKRSELLRAQLDGVDLDVTEVENLVSFLTFKGRTNWRDVPEGFDAKDLFPWRFRRRLSVLRKPLIQIDETEVDPKILVAPGVVRDAIVYMIGNYHRGDFPLWQLTPKMRKWAGTSRDRQGSEFATEVATRLSESGWEVETEVTVTKLLGRSFDRDYGDVDVLARKPGSDRVLLIECKDVQYRKTDGEIAEQLSDFRGSVRSDGKPDLLLKHLNRIEVIKQEATALARYLRLDMPPAIEGHLVFKNPVPMRYAWEHMKERISLHVFDDLGRI